jgi:hypothetical protein
MTENRDGRDVPNRQANPTFSTGQLQATPPIKMLLLGRLRLVLISRIQAQGPTISLTVAD